MTASSTTTVVLGKRKTHSEDDKLSIRLESSPPALPIASECDADASYKQPSTSTAHSSRFRRERRFRCSHAGCLKAYSKPSRLAEHERSHTGDRPFTCATCDKSYLRESHLQAHSRTHLPASARPFACGDPTCEKRFWTSQHLRVHSKLHKGENPFKCAEALCDASFLKHHQLREHICSAHAPTGTKPYRCEHAGCDKSFLTNQKLRGHTKTHDDKRYACVHASCLSTSPTYFPTWTALQHHLRTAHPPVCGHPTCNSKTFKSQKGLRAHMRLHDENAVEDLVNDESDADTSLGEPPLKKRRGGHVGRDWVCDVEGCEKDFKSKKALNTHNKVIHLGRRDFVCPHETCKKAFGYKHLLQRHLGTCHGITAKKPAHNEDADAETSSSEDAPAPTNSSRLLDIDEITGKAYVDRARQKLSAPRTLLCPFPDLHGLTNTAEDNAHTDKRCEYVFTRSYDLRRHLRSEHGEEFRKDAVDAWVNHARACKGTPPVDE
ncbi:hypothetical protein PHLGIDRAFT_61571 [Phlebiopsis gigantea 11061_1 CR5-6]|uniref:C2H2-type domain-containing protein n=1 Tax=Phlebiopsis gigantea (strain 11061_1 CR5-6) TaxID=745531 RepID=A0A0C3PWZ6_PHLG1|nr:hypothetical protein PHLGIDRAFT_61571 [Phlebiopsis gigantea 11061_1 CR5-6]